MPTTLSRSAVVGVHKLIELGVLSASGLEEFGNLVSTLQSLGGSRMASRAPAAGAPGRGRRTKFNVSAEELNSLYASHTIKEIAQMQGVSTGTVVNHLLKHGINKESAISGAARTKAASSTKVRRKPSAAKKASTKKTSKKKAKKR